MRVSESKNFVEKLGKVKERREYNKRHVLPFASMVSSPCSALLGLYVFPALLEHDGEINTRAFPCSGLAPSPGQHPARVLDHVAILVFQFYYCFLVLFYS